MATGYRRKKNSRFPFLWLTFASVSALLILLLIIIISPSTSQESEVETTAQLAAVVPAKNKYNPEAFYWEDGFLRYADREHLLGIDVSAHQGVIDWQKVADQNIDFAIIRIGYRGTTVGDLYEDEQFRYNLEQAQKYGLKVGAYFFSQALTEQEALQEAHYACELMEGYSLDLPLYFDWEYTEGRIPSISAVPVTDCAVAFCEEIIRQGHRPGIYFNLSLAYHHLDLGRLQNYHFWLAEYNKVPSYYYHFDAIQFADAGSVDGIETTVDLDLLFVE